MRLGKEHHIALQTNARIRGKDNDAIPEMVLRLGIGYDLQIPQAVMVALQVAATIVTNVPNAPFLHQSSFQAGNLRTQGGQILYFRACQRLSHPGVQGVLLQGIPRPSMMPRQISVWGGLRRIHRGEYSHPIPQQSPTSSSLSFSVSVCSKLQDSRMPRITALGSSRFLSTCTLTRRLIAGSPS